MTRTRDASTLSLSGAHILQWTTNAAYHEPPSTTIFNPGVLGGSVTFEGYFTGPKARSEARGFIDDVLGKTSDKRVKTMSSAAKIGLGEAIRD